VGVGLGVDGAAACLGLYIKIIYTCSGALAACGEAFPSESTSTKFGPTSIFPPSGTNTLDITPLNSDFNSTYKMY